MISEDKEPPPFLRLARKTLSFNMWNSLVIRGQKRCLVYSRLSYSATEVNPAA